MARRVVTEQGVSVRLACQIFTVSETCYRYEAKKNAENERIADWLLRLTDNHRNWGFGLCYLYLRNVKGFKWNHKRIYRIYKCSLPRQVDSEGGEFSACCLKSLGGNFPSAPWGRSSL